MSGITGFIDHNHKITEANLKKSSTSIAHRGGNGSGITFEKKEHYTLGIANQRLATTDLSDKVKQPLTSNCGDYSITLNGSIYNYLELRETLIKYGVIFSTLTDAEVILESYKKWGHKAFEMLDGSFAFAIFDRKQSQLLIAKDEIGAKPLYYYREKGFYAFASEIRALLTYTPIAKKVNKNAIATFFRYGYFDGEETIYENIFKFNKGILTIIDVHSGNSYDTPLTKQQLLNKPTENKQTEEQILNKIEDLLTESILNRNVGDVPIGILLSGGYDSATVAAILQKNQSKRIKTFTVGFKDEKLDEGPQARKIAEHLKTNHKEYYLDKNDALKIAKNLPNVFDEPIGDSGVIAQLFIAEKVKKEVKVLLGSEGGDELFGGYRTYAKAIKFNELSKKKWPKFFLNTYINFIKKTQPKMKAVLAAEDLLNKYMEINACFSIPQISRLLTINDFSFPEVKGQANDIKDLLIYDFHHYLPNNIFFKSDKCFTYHGIENRDAILKNDLVSYLTSLDSSWFIKDGDQKYLLKKITNKYIPSNLMDRPKKGLAIPLTKWLKTTLKPLVDEYLKKEKLKYHGLLNVDEVLRIKAAFNLDGSAHHAQKIWLLLQFQMWYYKWMV